MNFQILWDLGTKTESFLWHRHHWQLKTLNFSVSIFLLHDSHPRNLQMSWYMQLKTCKSVVSCLIALTLTLFGFFRKTCRCLWYFIVMWLWCTLIHFADQVKAKELKKQKAAFNVKVAKLQVCIFVLIFNPWGMPGFYT